MHVELHLSLLGIMLPVQGWSWDRVDVAMPLLSMSSSNIGAPGAAGAGASATGAPRNPAAAPTPSAAIPPAKAIVVANWRGSWPVFLARAAVGWFARASSWRAFEIPVKAEPDSRTEPSREVAWQSHESARRWRASRYRDHVARAADEVSR
jgi:hypothetical protein